MQPAFLVPEVTTACSRHALQTRTPRRSARDGLGMLVDAATGLDSERRPQDRNPRSAVASAYSRAARARDGIPRHIWIASSLLMKPIIPAAPTETQAHAVRAIMCVELRLRDEERILEQERPLSQRRNGRFQQSG